MGITARSLSTGFAVLSVHAAHGERREIKLVVSRTRQVAPKIAPICHFPLVVPKIEKILIFKKIYDSFSRS